MSLKITTEMATDKQLEWLKEHEYYGTLKLTKASATDIIESLMEQERHLRNRPEQAYWDRVKAINGKQDNMALTVSASSGGGNFPLVPEGVYTARCFKIIDLGTQWIEWAGEKKEQRKVLITWELLDDEVKMEDGRPFAATKQYTATLDERGRLRPDLEAWRGKKFTDAELEAFDLKTVLGAYCTIQIVHDETGKYANVNSIMAFKGEKPKPVNPDVAFDIDEPDMEVFATFSDKMKEKIQAAPEFRIATAPKEEAPKTDEESLGKAAETFRDELESEPVNLDDIPFQT